MNQPETNDELLSTQRLAQPSPGLQERVLEAAHDAWAEAEPAGLQIARPLSGSERTPGWQFAATAALVLFTGLNVIQSAGNLTAARESPLPPVARMADAEVEALADGIGIPPGDVKRMLLLGPLHD